MKNTLFTYVKGLLLPLLFIMSFEAIAQADSTGEKGLKSFINAAELKGEISTCLMMFVAGAADGVSQDLLFHYHEFERSTGLTGAQYWDPDLSWRNKYKDGDPENGAKFFGSTTFLVGLTDGYHASRSLRDTMIILSIATSPKETAPKDIVKKAFIYTMFYGSGFTIVYDYLIK